MVVQQREQHRPPAVQDRAVQTVGDPQLVAGGGLEPAERPGRPPVATPTLAGTATTTAVAGLDEASGGAVREAGESGEFRGRAFELFVTRVDGWKTPRVILIATGTEVALAVSAFEELSADGVRTRVVSMPSWELFERQPQEYRDQVLPPDITARVAIEQASTFGWERYVGSAGRVVGMRTFGASAPLKALQKKFGFEPDWVATLAKELLAKQ